jgi:hypothetical protein
MRLFVLRYDQATGDVAIYTFEPDETNAALARRFALERAARDQPNVEVVLLGAPSLESLKTTHARYFKTVEQLTAANVA